MPACGMPGLAQISAGLHIATVSATACPPSACFSTSKFPDIPRRIMIPHDLCDVLHAGTVPA